MSLEFNQLFWVSWTKMEKLQALHVELRLEGKMRFAGAGREKGLFCPCPQGRGSSGNRRTVTETCLWGPVLGHPCSCLLSDIEDLLWNKEHLACCLFLIVDLTDFHWPLSLVQAVPGTSGSEMNKDSSSPPGPPGWWARHRAHKQPRGTRGLRGATGIGTALGGSCLRIYDLLCFITLSDMFPYPFLVYFMFLEFRCVSLF